MPRSTGTRASLISATAFVAGVSGGIAGYTQGGLGAGLGGVVGGIGGLAAGASYDRMERRRSKHAELRAGLEDCLQQPVSGLPAAGTTGVFDLIVAKRRISPLLGRQQEMERLTSWCHAEDESPFRILSGIGGVGKTRLATELSQSLPENWVSGWLKMGLGPALMRLARECKDPTLVLIDNFVARSDLPEFLEILADDYLDAPVKVLAIARDHDAAQAILRNSLTDSARWLASSPPTQLLPHGSNYGRRQWFDKIVTAYARALHLDPPHWADTVAVGAADEPMLVLQIRAVLALLDESSSAAPQNSVEELADGLLDHEAAWWLITATTPGRELPMSISSNAPLLKRILLCLTLFRPVSSDEAARLLARLPELSNEPKHMRKSIAKWAFDLYPDAQDLGFEISPHLLSQWFVISQLSKQEDLWTELFSDLRASETEAALSLFLGATSNFPAARAMTLRLLSDSVHPGALPAALKEAASAGISGAMDRELAALITSMDLPSQTFADLDWISSIRSLPWTRLALARLRVAAKREDEPQSLAISLTQLGHLLREMHLAEEARMITAEAVSRWREIVEIDATERLSLATAQLLFSDTLADCGYLHDAMNVAEQCILLLEDLAKEDSSNMSHLAVGLGTLSARLDDLGRSRQALDATARAVDFWEELTESDSSYRHELADSYRYLGRHLSAVGEYEAAREAASRAVEAWRELAQDNASYLANLARALRGLCERESEEGRIGDSRASIEESVKLWRVATRTNPALRPDLAEALRRMAWAHAEERGAASGLATMREAMEITQELSAEDDIFVVDLALCTYDFAQMQGANGLDASNVAKRALNLLREAAKRSVACRPVLATALFNQGATLWVSKHDVPAYLNTEEAREIWSALAIESPSALGRVADCSHNLAVISHSLGEHDLERDHLKGAVAKWEILHGVEPDLYAPNYRQAVGRLKAWKARHDDGEDEMDVNRATVKPLHRPETPDVF